MQTLKKIAMRPDCFRKIDKESKELMKEVVGGTAPGVLMGGTLGSALAAITGEKQDALEYDKRVI